MRKIPGLSKLRLIRLAMPATARDRGCSGSAARLCGRASPFQAAQPLWSAAACCRFSAASLLALRPVRGQQAGLKKSGSKLPHS
ncbi:MAG: hypothetical protein ABSH52_23395, partial [Terriglobia bacterium]